jgi:hypothetical protein
MCVGKKNLRVGLFNKIISWVALEEVSVIVRKKWHQSIRNECLSVFTTAATGFLLTTRYYILVSRQHSLNSEAKHFEKASK